MKRPGRGRGPVVAGLLALWALAGAADGDWQIARLKYSGGGDWYNDPDAIPNLAREVNRRTRIRLSTEEAQVSLLDDKLYQYPFLFVTGHGNILFGDAEVRRLRHFLESGGFLYADDDYGMDESFRREMKKVLPGSEFVEIGFDDDIYREPYSFPSGPPKIHEHYDGPPKGLGLFVGGRMVVYYTYNSNVSDGWTTAHNDPPDVRETALLMGVNIVNYFCFH
jgi:hypothetical protein